MVWAMDRLASKVTHGLWDSCDDPFPIVILSLGVREDGTVHAKITRLLNPPIMVHHLALMRIVFSNEPVALYKIEARQASDSFLSLDAIIGLVPRRGGRSGIARVRVRLGDAEETLLVHADDHVVPLWRGTLMPMVSWDVTPRSKNFVLKTISGPPPFVLAAAFDGPPRRELALANVVHPRGAAMPIRKLPLVVPMRDLVLPDLEEALDRAREHLSEARVRARCRTIFEELMARAWHPAHVVKLLEAGDAAGVDEL